jgi:HSP20 family protein
MSGLVKQENAGEAATLERTRGGATFSPRIDILETQEELTLYGDMPGVAPDDLDIRFENRELSIYGKVAQRHEEVQYLY